MTFTVLREKALFLLAAVAILSACSSGPQITRILDVPESADAPYHNVLVISLLSKFESRRRLEKAVAEKLSGLGIKAVASTSLMNTDTPVTRQTFLKMVEELGSDAVLVTKLVDADAKIVMKDSASPEATYKVRSADYYRSYYHPSYYYNVWEVELTEYTEPQNFGSESSIVLATELYSVLSHEAVWAIESRSRVVIEGSLRENYMVFVDEADAIVKHMSRDGLVAR